MASQQSLGGTGGSRAAFIFDLGEATPGANALLLANLQRHQQTAQMSVHQQHAAHHPSCPHAPPPPALAGAGVAPPPHVRQHGAAARLNSQLQSLEAQGSLGGTATGPEAAADQGSQPPQQGSQPELAAAATATDASLRSRLAGFALRVGDMLQPQGEAPGDATWGERTANVLTSLPFLALGLHMHRQRLTPEGRHHALSMAAVGVAATAYHAASGRARRIARKVDYWTIAYTSTAMVKALFADSCGVRRAANLSLLALPFRPFHVSAANTLIMQAEFARQAAGNKAVRADLHRHYAAALLGMAAFFGEDMVMDSGYGGFVHAAWHCLATYSMYTINGLLGHKERQVLRRQLARQQGAGAAGKPLRRPVHSSASSLPSYGGAKRGGWSTGTASP
ncbi:hypothetical protein CHLNCDRAFT_144168 [Chlorella variabilis]|uniref:Uncharacterized protein n=1 Tax=Chlorella variabilis TaxID=554065 RepID=E1ZC24_CHLVA|nr:hypothetical protein CHLNCDRAFT_144168 [Chlorella variabilis]EFN56739.1 hypothetical protein CHLNCDRAFT_144168 [Chlorella variabilis]|eukprot:XP_005848841.1 hypothetical protein CHLNCDRAFT_144168 [Chlorella variabilis]